MIVVVVNIRASKECQNKLNVPMDCNDSPLINHLRRGLQFDPFTFVEVYNLTLSLQGEHLSREPSGVSIRNQMLPAKSRSLPIGEALTL